MKKVLIIEESRLLLDYLMKKAEDSSLEAIPAANGFEGSMKLRNEQPDLIIMDQILSRKSSMELLNERTLNPNTKNTPVILITENITQEELMRMARLGVSRVLSKPLKLDALLKSISSILGIEITLDQSPCIIESHFNEEILFIEVAQGLNTEKLMLLKYRIMELLSIYNVRKPKVLVMISSIEFDEKNTGKLDLLFQTILENAQDNPGLIKVLSTSSEVGNVLESNPDYRGIGMVGTLDKAMDDLIGVKPDAFAHDEVAREKLLKSTHDGQGSVELRFESESTVRKLSLASDVAIVDDDFIIRTLIRTVFEETGWNMVEFENGKAFLEGLDQQKFDLVFLDLNMPVVNGFQVLQQLKKKEYQSPVIVFSALSRKETILKARELGVSFFLRKPLKPDALLSKVAEILGREFE